VGGRLISLSAYRELKLEANQEIAKRSSVRVRAKKLSCKNLVGRSAIDRRLCPGKVNSKWRDYTFILMATFFLSCLALVALGL
jgi:hypothetical protein